MKILMVSSYLPYPLLDGGKIRLYNLLKLLKEKHEITLVCETRPNQTKEDIGEVEKVCAKLLVYQRPKAFSLGNALKSVLSANSFLTTVHSHRRFADLIKKELAENKYDLIHVETFYVMQNLPKTDIPIVLVEHNIEYKVYKRNAKKESIIARPLLLVDALKIKRAEINSWKKADVLVAVSPVEQEAMGGDTKLVRNGVDLEKFSLKKLDFNKKEKLVLFIGNFKWIQNRDAAAYIIKNIWPQVLTKNKDALDLKLWIVGKNIPESVKLLADRSILIDENAPSETERIFQKADLLLSPIRVGGGTNFKILESMASGTPVVTNHLGNEGLEALNNEELVICEEPAQFAEKIISLLSDKYLYEKISRNGRRFIEKNYDWRAIAKDLDSIYKSLTK